MTPLLLSLLLLLVKSLCVFALAGLMLFALRRASAASRHLVCLLTLAALLALPLFSGMPFSLPVPIEGPPAPILGSQSKNLTPRPLLPKGEGAGELGAGAEGAQSGPQTESGGQERAAAPTPVLAPALHPAPQNWGGGASLLALWLLGALAAAFRPLLGLWGIKRLHRTSRAETSSATLTTAAECAALLDLALVPAVRRGEVPVPITWGLGRPVVLLPDAADTWPDGRLRAVLLHELAHIRRRDWAAHRLADLACALYWFHPLVWLTARRLRAESEMACDDLVLSCGIPAPDYARHLLDIARALSAAKPYAPTGAIGMARTAHVEGRITQMLNPAQNRRALPRRTVFAALLAATLSVGALAALRPEARAQVPSNPKPIQQSAKTSSEIIGITNAAMPKQGWWDRDGKPILAPAFSAGLHLSDGHITAKPGERPLFIAFRYLPASKEVLHLADISGETQNGLTLRQTATNPRRKMSVKAQSLTIGLSPNIIVEGAAFPVSLPQTKIRIGTPSPQWTTALVFHYGFHGDAPVFTPKDHFGGTVELSNGKIKCTLPVKNPRAFYDLCIKTVDKNGQQTPLPTLKLESYSDHEVMTVAAPRNSTQLQEIRVEAKPFIWTVYNNVALQPAQAEAHP